MIMPDIKAVLSEEIRRLAKKEIRTALIPLVKTVTEQRHTISELKKRIAVLEKSGITEKAVRESDTAPAEAIKKLRLNAAGIVRVRTKLKLTQNEFAKLLGVSLHTVSFWELGKASPRAEAKAAICALRSAGKREIKRRLAVAETDA